MLAEDYFGKPFFQEEIRIASLHSQLLYKVGFLQIEFGLWESRIEENVLEYCNQPIRVLRKYGAADDGEVVVRTSLETTTNEVDFIGYLFACFLFCAFREHIC